MILRGGMSVSYVHLPPEAHLPSIGEAGPFRAVLVLEQAVADDWQSRVSEWLVKSGCLYMMAWGVECSSWDDSVDWANLSVVGLEDIPDDQFVMTTWHDNEPLAETFWFAGFTAHHPTVPLEHVAIIDIGSTNRESEMLQAYEAAQTIST
jgi:hypothetical protein